MKTDVLLRTMKSPKFVNLINILMGFVLIVSTLFFIRNLLTNYTVKNMDTPRYEETLRPEINLGLLDYGIIMKKNPFGFPAGELRPISATASESALLPKPDLFLIGTVSGQRNSSYAVFTDKTGMQEVFRLGEQVFGHGTLKKVDITRVTIHSEGKDSVIEFSDLMTAKEIKAESIPAAGMAFGKKTGPAAYQVNQRLVQEAIEKPDRIMTDARFVPNVVQGTQQGFILKEVKPGGIYQSLGLQNDDILLRINEYDISNPETALQAFTALRGIDRAELDIMRKGARMTMSYQIR
jgi:type II secretion system protein C